MLAKSHQSQQEHHRQILINAFHKLCHQAPQGLDPLYAQAFCQASDDSDRYRIIIDHLASLTESRLEATQIPSPAYPSLRGK